MFGIKPDKINDPDNPGKKVGSRSLHTFVCVVVTPEEVDLSDFHVVDTEYVIATSVCEENTVCVLADARSWAPRRFSSKSTDGYWSYA